MQLNGCFTRWRLVKKNKTSGSRGVKTATKLQLLGLGGLLFVLSISLARAQTIPSTGAVTGGTNFSVGLRPDGTDNKA